MGRRYHTGGAYRRLGAAALTLTLTVVPTLALATHDAGESLAVARMDDDGRHLLVVRCHVQGALEGVFVRTVGASRAVSRLSAEDVAGPDVDGHPLCDDAGGRERFLTRLKGGRLASLIVKYKLTVPPIVGGPSPDGSRYGLLVSAPNRVQPKVVEGRRLKAAGKPVPLSRDAPGASHFSGRVLWHPNGLLIVTEVSAVQRFKDGVVDWRGFIRAHRFKQRAPETLSARKVSAELNNEGYRRDKRARQATGEPWPEDPHRLYALAVKVDPSNETAIYNVACMEALMGKRDAAMSTLGRLQRLGTPKARAKLKKAPADKDFESLRGMPAFKRLTDL